MTIDREKPPEFTTILNKSWYFCLPLLANSITQFFNLRGCFVGAEDYPKYNSHIFLLFYKNTSPVFEKKIADLKTKENYILTYEPDDNHIMLIFKPEDYYTQNYKLFRDSRYSKLSPDFKKHIILFHGIKGEKHKLVRALYKHKALREKLMDELGVNFLTEEDELLSLLDPKKEIFTNEIKGGL